MKAIKYAAKLRHFKNDPTGFIVDTIIGAVVNLFIPIPLAGELAIMYKKPVLGCMMSFIVLMLFIMTVAGSIFLFPLLVPSGFLNTITSYFSSEAPALHDASFIQTAVPMQIPFGGEGMEFAVITASFMDPSYLLKFGKNHTGIDLVPNENYYKDNQVYKETKKVIIFATHSGKATYYVDSNGGETVEVLSGDSGLKTIYIHMKKVYVSTGDPINAGTPLGEMGGTGFATGEHVHYEVRINSSGTWIPVNPLTYIR
jgi:murein DD-endopeptidase MepM/ murein hydrolase activator NlpD